MEIVLTDIFKTIFEIENRFLKFFSTSQQYAYPTAAAAYAQYGQTAAQQQQTPTNQAAATVAAGFGSQMDYTSVGNFENYGYSTGLLKKIFW